MVKIIGLGEYMVSDDINDSIKTYALATCVGLVVYNKRDRKLGMVHIVLPDKKDTDNSDKKAAFFANEAVPLIFNKVFGGYPDKDTPYKVSLYGGCVSKHETDVFNVGIRNVEKIENMLNKYHIKYDKSNTGGHCSRTIEAYVIDGSVRMHTQAMSI